MMERGAIMRNLRTVLIIVFVVFCFFPKAEAAVPGTLDASFNYPNGYVLFNSAANNRDRGAEVAIQTDGKIVVLGHSNNGINDDVLVARYNTNGTLDGTFGTGGFVLYDSGGNERGLGLALQSDGKIIAVGYTYVGIQRDVLVLRYNSNGTLDGTFGTGGVVTYSSAGAFTDIGFGVGVQSDGKIVVVGETSNGINQDALVLRYQTNGLLDNTFGTAGVFRYAGPGINMDRAFAMAIQTDGKILVVGASVVLTKDDVLLFRLNTNGTLDATFGTGGVVTYSGTGDNFDYGNALALQTDGRIVVLGASSNGLAFDILLLRYDADGTLDNTFGTGGVVVYGDAGNLNDYGYGLVIQSDGRIVITGYSQGATSSDLLAARFRWNGTLDTTFGANGVFTWNGTGNGTDYGQGIALQSDSKLVITGFSHNGVNEDLLVMRLMGYSYDNNGSVRCFIATAAYGSHLDPHVAVLRKFRDEHLLKNDAGRMLIHLYYRYSPTFASWIERHDSLRFAFRCVLNPVVLALEHPRAAFLAMLIAGMPLAGVALQRRRKRE
jgi:uncharacterized delta-60 repeat protein